MTCARQVCQEMGCFECYDIYCERCESKDRRIIELEMRNTELVEALEPAEMAAGITLKGMGRPWIFNDFSMFLLTF